MKELSTDLQNFVTDKIRSGEYETEDDVVNTALSQMKMREDALRQVLSERVEQADRGDFSARTVIDIIADKEREYGAR